MIPPGARVWIAMGHTDMRKGMQGLAIIVQQALRRDPFAGDLYVFRGRAGSLVKIVWHDGIGMSAAREGPLHLALSDRRDRVADGLAVGVSSRRDRLA